MSGDDQLGEETRKRPVRLSRSGLPIAEGSEPESDLEEGEEGAEVIESEEVWGGHGHGGQRVPIVVVKAAAIILPLIGAWLLWTVVSRKPGDNLDPLAVPRVDLSKGDDLTPSGVAIAFLNAKSIDERLKLTYRAAAAREHAKDFPDEVLATPMEAESVTRMDSERAMGELNLHRFAVVLPDGGRRLLCVVETPAGMRVDWEGFARYGSAALGDAEQRLFGEATVRVFVKDVKYYDFEFSDEQEWLSFELSNPDWDRAVNGYAKRGSTTGKILRSAVARAGEEGRRMILRVQGDRGEPRHFQFEIDRVLSVGWVIGEGDFEWSWEQAQAARKDGPKPPN